MKFDLEEYIAGEGINTAFTLLENWLLALESMGEAGFNTQPLYGEICLLMNKAAEHERKKLFKR